MVNDKVDINGGDNYFLKANEEQRRRLMFCFFEELRERGIIDKKFDEVFDDFMVCGFDNIRFQEKSLVSHFIKDKSEYAKTIQKKSWDIGLSYTYEVSTILVEDGLKPIDYVEEEVVYFEMQGWVGLYFCCPSYNKGIYGINLQGNSGVIFFKKDKDKIHQIFVDDLSEYTDDYEIAKAKVFNEINGTVLSWENVILEEKFLKDIRSNIENFMKAHEFYKEHNLPYKRGMLLVGPPGNGKSLIVSILKSLYEAKISYIEDEGQNPADICKQIKEIYNFRPTKQHHFVVIEEIDKLTDRENIRGCLLGCMDGVDYKVNSDKRIFGTLTIATANEPEKIHKAFTQRPSRFDRVFKFTNPKMEEKVRYFMLLSNNKYGESDVRKILADTQYLSMAGVKEIYINACLSKIDDKQLPSVEDMIKSAELISRQFKQGENGFYDNGERLGLRKDKQDNDLVYGDDKSNVN